MAAICKTFRKMTLAKTEWIWNATHQKIFNKAKTFIKEDSCMKFYDETKPLHIEMDASGVGLGAALLQTRSSTSCPRDEVQDNSLHRPITFANKNLSSVEKRHINIEREGPVYYMDLKNSTTIAF